MNTDGPLTFTGLIKFLQYIKGPDHWHNVGDTGEPAFEDSWVNYGGDWQDARFRKDVSGVVHIEGMVKDGSIGVGTAVFTLPVGYRPAGNLDFTTTATGGTGRMLVYAGGAVSAHTGDTTWYSINCSFYVG